MQKTRHITAISLTNDCIPVRVSATKAWWRRGSEGMMSLSLEIFSFFAAELNSFSPILYSFHGNPIASEICKLDL
jgi:hypothetical protein